MRRSARTKKPSAGTIDSAVNAKIRAVSCEYWASADIRAAIPVTLTGPRQEVGFDRVLQPTVTLLPHD